MQINKIVKGNNLKELLENALNKSEINYEYLGIKNYSLKNNKRTIVAGNLFIDSGYPKHDKTNFQFEVNIGTHKDELVLFDEFEVIIE